ncbi:MAG: DoxX family membrane protein, partial [Candidatus Nanopelagicales bacterium]
MLTAIGRLGLGIFLIVAGVGHFVSTSEFLAQVPPWMPAPELVIFVSGVCELVLGSALIVAPSKWQPLVGWVTAAFFVVIFP